MTPQLLLWIAFSVGILVMLAIDLGVFHKTSHVESRKEALAWSAVWVSLALLFAGGVAVGLGKARALEFLTGWVIEKSLSVDNLFVFILVFGYFKVEPKLQHRVLFWGIIGALVMRGALIAAGAALVERFQWILYLFGALLIYTAVKMALAKEDDKFEPEKNPIVQLFRKHFRVVDHYEGDRFFVVREGKRYATPLFIVVLVVETTDLIFATDSIPAIFGVTTDAFVVYTSNVFAILGLRALYFLLAGVLDLFRFLKHGISLVLGFIGSKMVIREWFHIPIGVSLTVVGAVLFLSILLSVIFPAPKAAAPAAGESAD